MYILSYFNKQQIFKTMLLAPLFLSAFSLSIHAMDDSSVGLEEWISEIFAKSPEEQTVDQDLILTDLLWQPLDFTDLDCADNNISTALDNLASEIATTQRSNPANKRQKTTQTNTPAATSNIKLPEQLSYLIHNHQKSLEDVIDIHPQNKSYKCNTYCCYYRGSLEEVIQHMKEAHPRKIAICPFCSAGYIRKDDLHLHIKRIHKETTQLILNNLTNIPAAISNLKFHQEPLTSKHQKSLEEGTEIHPQNKIYKCNIRGCRYPGSCEEVIQHMKKSHPRKKFICQVCGAGYAKTWTLGRHINRMHKETTQLILNNLNQMAQPIPTTQSSSNKNTALSISQPVATPQVPVTLNSQLLTLRKIKRLTRKIYNMQPPKQDLIDLTKDAEPHTAQQPPVDQYRCNAPNCTYQAPLNKLLKHAKQGHPERTFICQLCGCSYNNESQVKSHMRIYHHQTDTIQEPQNPLHYQCTTLDCNYAGPLHSLIEHMRQYHANNQFVCRLCGCSYRYNPLLESHMKTYHLS